MPKPPFLSRSGLTNRWWLVTRYSVDVGGNRIANEKWPFDEAVGKIKADALREVAKELLDSQGNAGSPADMAEIHQWLRDRADELDGGEHD